MRILLVHVSVPESHEYLKAAVERCMAFNEAYEGRADTNRLYLELTAAFYHKNPAHLLYIGVDESDKIVASGFASMMEYMGAPVVNCDQLWRNTGTAVFGPGQIEKTLESIAKWGRANGAKHMRTYAINPKIAEIAEAYGWKRTPQILLEMDITEE